MISLKRLDSTHKTHRETLVKFLLLVLVVIAYFTYLSLKFDIATGGMLSALTWSFFVLCTPIADAGFLLDFPLRLLFGVRMWKTEVGVWALAITINILGLSYYPETYDQTFLTGLFKDILLTPYPYWGIIVLSGAGTFLSIYFGDEMLDVAHHRDREKHHKFGARYRILLTAGLFLLALAAYAYLLDSLGINIDY